MQEKEQRIPALKRPTQKCQLSILIFRGCVTFALSCLDICSCVLRLRAAVQTTWISWDRRSEFWFSKRSLQRNPICRIFCFGFFSRFFSPTSKRSAHTHGRTKGTFKIKADVGANANQSQETRKHKEITEGGNTRIRAGSSGTRGPSEMGSQKNIWRQQIFKFEHKQENKLSAVHLSLLITWCTLEAEPHSLFVKLSESR